MSHTTDAMIRGEWPGPTCENCGANEPACRCRATDDCRELAEAARNVLAFARKRLHAAQQLPPWFDALDELADALKQPETST